MVILCSHCRRRPATRLCDAPIGRSRYIGHPPRSLMQKAKMWDIAWAKVEMESVITCDRPICENCATQVAAGIDYCPECMNRIKATPTYYGRRNKK